MTKEELIKMLREQLGRHDWWFMMSDDNRYYTAGRDQREKIEDTKTKLVILGMTSNEINAIHNEFAPEEKQIEVTEDEVRS